MREPAARVHAGNPGGASPSRRHPRRSIRPPQHWTATPLLGKDERKSPAAHRPQFPAHPGRGRACAAAAAAGLRAHRFAGTTLNQTGQAVEVIAMTMAVYLTISLAISLIMNWYNARIALTER